MKERKRFYLKKNVDLGVLEDLGLKTIPPYKNYWGKDLEYNNLQYSVFVDTKTREISIYMNNSCYFKTSEEQYDYYKGNRKMVDEEEVMDKLAFEEYLDIPEELFTLISNGYVEMRIDYEGN